MKKILTPFALASLLATVGCNGGSTITANSALSEGDQASIEAGENTGTTEPAESIDTIEIDETISTTEAAESVDTTESVETIDTTDPVESIDTIDPDETSGTAEPTETVVASPPVTLRDEFSGATFVSAEQLGSADNGLTPSHWVISFTADQVTWTQSEVTQIGTHAFDDNFRRVADISGREITFNGNGNDLFWDSQTYHRTTSALFDSQETLKTQFDGTRYNSVEDLPLGENESNELVMGKWSVQFKGDQIHLASRDTIAVGTYSYIDNRSFNVSLGNSDTPAYILANDRLMVRSVVYEKDFSNLFNSQETLVSFLNNTTYKSAGLQPIGEVVNGALAVGNWFIDFTDNTFVWSAQLGDEAGTIEYLTNNTFKAVFSDREYVVEMRDDDILWDGVRYIKN